MYRFIVLYVCIYVAPWSCEARHFVPLYVPTCSGMTIKLNLNLNLTLKVEAGSRNRNRGNSPSNTQVGRINRG